MLRLVGDQVESLFDGLLPVEVRELPADLAMLDRLLGDPLVLTPIDAGVGAHRPWAWSPNDPDGQLCATDGDQAAHWLGVRDAGPGGVGLAAPAPVLPAGVDPAGAGRVDGAQAGPSARAGDGRRADPGGDRQGAAGRPALWRGRCGSTPPWSRPTSGIRPTRCWPGRARRALAREGRKLAGRLHGQTRRVVDRSRQIGKTVRAISRTLSPADRAARGGGAWR